MPVSRSSFPPAAVESLAQGDPIPFVDVDWVAAHLADPDVRVIEVDVDPTSYREGHVPGGLLWNIYSDLRHADYRPISGDELDALLSRSGVSRTTTVAFYGYGAHLGYWLLKRHGHARVRLLDGGREQWHDSGRAWTQVEPAPVPAPYACGAWAAEVDETRETILAGMGEPGRVLLDVRSSAEYEGERFWPSGAAAGAGRAGHVPGSIHLPIESLKDEHGRLADADTIRRALEGRGITRETRVVTYCTIGNRASQAWVALRYLLGFPDAAVYFGSWAEWGLHPGSPVERGSDSGQGPGAAV